MLIYVGFCCICVGFYVIWSIFVGNECCLVWVGTGNFLQSATLYAHFSESKRWTKDFRRSNAAAKARLRGGFHSKECKCLPQLTTPPKAQKSSFCIVPETVSQNRRATSARIWGFIRSKTILERLLLFIYSNSQQDTLFCSACLSAR